jgi:LysM repeat protein
MDVTQGVKVVYDINSNILTKTGCTAGQLQAAAAAIRGDHGFNDFQAFCDAENRYDLNSIFIVAHAAIESAWGTSFFARKRNNLFGFNAVDSDPDLANSYASQRVSILDYADFLDRHYLHAGQIFFNGATPHGIFVRYSSSHDAEATSVVSIMNHLAALITGTPTHAPAMTSGSRNPSSGIYSVKQGDSMASIAAAHHLTLAQLEALNPSAGHPAGNFANIWPGDVLRIEATSPAASPPPSFVTVHSGDTLSAIAARHGLTLQKIELLNPNAGHPAGNFGNIWPGDQIRVG